MADIDRLASDEQAAAQQALFEPYASLATDGALGLSSPDAPQLARDFLAKHPDLAARFVDPQHLDAQLLTQLMELGGQLFGRPALA